MIDVGDTRRLTWEHRDELTGAPVNAATVTASILTPAGSTAPLDVANPAAGQYEALWTFTLPGVYVVTWTSIGPAQVDEQALYAVPAGASAPWAPGLADVAAFVPSRTRQVGTTSLPGDNVPAGTFNDDTEPTGDIVQRLVGSAVAFVQGRIGSPVAEAAYPIAGVAAALWAATWVEIGYPERDADVSVYQRLEAHAEEITKQAAAVNVAAGGGTDGSGGDDAVPEALVTFAFPGAPPWADSLL